MGKDFEEVGNGVFHGTTSLFSWENGEKSLRSHMAASNTAEIETRLLSSVVLKLLPVKLLIL